MLDIYRYLINRNLFFCYLSERRLNCDRFDLIFDFVVLSIFNCISIYNRIMRFCWKIYCF